MLKIIGVEESETAVGVVKIDSFVPISFRSRDRPIGGARHVGLGDSKTELLELQFPPETSTLTGFTLTSCNASYGTPLVGGGHSSAGLPIIDLSQASFSGRFPRVDLEAQISLFQRDDQAEIRIGDAKLFDRTVAYGRTEFLFGLDILVGLRVLQLTKDEVKMLRDYMSGRPN